MALVDTDIMIDVLRQFPVALAWLASLGAETIVVPGFVALELLQGCRNRVEQEKVEPVALTTVPTLNQKQAYSVVNRTKGNTINKDPKVNEERQRSGIDDEVIALPLTRERITQNMRWSIAGHYAHAVTTVGDADGVERIETFAHP